MEIVSVIFWIGFAVGFSIGLAILILFWSIKRVKSTQDNENTENKQGGVK